jgi:hypothetical protein
MELYFASMKSLSAQPNPRNLVTFAIPDIGVRFKAPYPAEDLTLEYASLLTLLEFIDINPGLFTNRALELFCHNADLVNQIKARRVDQPNLAPYLKKALEYRERLKYSINWVPPDDNPARRTEID